MKAIIAVNNLGFIGLGSQLPWRCKEDLKHFKRMTLGCHLLVGYRTMNSLPPLNDRVLCVDSKEQFSEGSDWCIGGKKTYEKYAKYFTEIHISHINDNTIGNVTFPDLSELNPVCKIFNYKFEPDR